MPTRWWRAGPRGRSWFSTTITTTWRRSSPRRWSAAAATVSLVTTAGTAAAWSYPYRRASRHEPAPARAGGGDPAPAAPPAPLTASALAIDCVFTGKRDWLPAAGVVSVTAREPNDALYLALSEDPAALARAGIRSLRKIGDCDAPALIAHAVYAGHRAAQELDADSGCDPAADRAAECVVHGARAPSGEGRRRDGDAEGITRLSRALLPLSRHPGVIPGSSPGRGPGASGNYPPCGRWIPAFAGMTIEVEGDST